MFPEWDRQEDDVGLERFLQGLGNNLSPNITSLRFQFGLALGYVMLAEAIAAESGLGVMLNSNARLGNFEQNYALLFIIAMLAFVIDFLIRFFQRGVFQWRRDL